ncbi:MAG: AIR synthase-related protein [Sphingobacterium sp.]|nr:AIR synthase-related protein [Sphingobacterium sp.]
MSELNRHAAEGLDGSAVHACTDVTGFGLLGHLKEMITGSEVDAEISYGKVPLLQGAAEYAEAGMVPGGSLNNLDFASDLTDWGKGISETQKKILADAQTSGGLLLSMPETDARNFLGSLSAEGRSRAAVIGKIVRGTGKIKVVS